MIPITIQQIKNGLPENIPYLQEFLRATSVVEEKLGYILVSRLKEIIVQLDPSFNERHYGRKNFSDFLQIYTDLGIIKKNKEGTRYILEYEMKTIDHWNELFRQINSN